MMRFPHTTFRNTAIAACVAVVATAVTAGPAIAVPQNPGSVAAASENASTPTVIEAGALSLPDGQARGDVVDVAENGAEIFEVLDADGTRVGYTFSDAELAKINAAAAATAAELAQSTSGDEQTEALQGDGPVFTAASGVNVPLCVAAVGWFVAQTVFPAARVANLAVRLTGLVSKYGVQTVARILTGARGIAGRTAEQEIKDFALAASGVGGLAACGIQF